MKTIKNLHFQRALPAIPYVCEIWRSPAIQCGEHENYFLVLAVWVMVDGSILAEVKLFNKDDAGSFAFVCMDACEFVTMLEAFQHCEKIQKTTKKILKEFGLT